MAKFYFKKPFSQRITVGGAVGIAPYNKNIGDEVEGERISNDMIRVRLIDYRGIKMPKGGDFDRLRGQEFIDISTAFLSSTPIEPIDKPRAIPIGKVPEAQTDTSATPTNKKAFNPAIISLLLPVVGLVAVHKTNVIPNPKVKKAVTYGLIAFLALQFLPNPFTGKSNFSTLK